MTNDPDYLSCKKKECKKSKNGKCRVTTCSGSLKFHVINIRTDIEFVFFSGGFATPCVLTRSTPLSFSNPKKPLYAHISSTDSSGTSVSNTALLCTRFLVHLKAQISYITRENKQKSQQKLSLVEEVSLWEQIPWSTSRCNAPIIYFLCMEEIVFCVEKFENTLHCTLKYSKSKGSVPHFPSLLKIMNLDSNLHQKRCPHVILNRISKIFTFFEG